MKRPLDRGRSCTRSVLFQHHASFSATPGLPPVSTARTKHSWLDNNTAIFPTFQTRLSSHKSADWPPQKRSNSLTMLSKISALHLLPIRQNLPPPQQYSTPFPFQRPRPRAPLHYSPGCSKVHQARSGWTPPVRALPHHHWNLSCRMLFFPFASPS